ncbi:MAG: carboxypeptidase-like regulatory domain-containing protein [Candidatus Acidiferrum sp.]|jgi:hypothetical protein
MPHRLIRFRVVLPVVFGFLAAMLMLWDYENNRMIALMGMGWDMGPPFWPYQAVYLFLYSVNAPAFVLSMPILKLLNLQSLSLQYAIWFPAIVGWWWWIGSRIDLGIISHRHYRYAKLLGSVLAAASLGFIGIAVRVIVGEIRWWMQYAHDYSPYRASTLLTTIGPAMWCLLLAGGCAVAAIRLWQEGGAQAEKSHRRYRPLLIGVSLVALYVFAIHRWDKALNPPLDYSECTVDLLHGLGCVHGTVVDESGKPISHIEVDLIPIAKTGTARFYGIRSERTDEQGRYNLNGVEAAEYFLAVNAFSAFGAPTAELPFATVYYPAAENESGAAPLRVARSTPLHLPPLRLRRLELATIKINVKWSDGTRPRRSDIFFQNVLYERAVGTLPQIDNGVGEFTLPKGFEYDASSSVDCHKGNVHESRESLPYQRIKVADGSTPAEMTFVIQGPPCVLWDPD